MSLVNWNLVIIFIHNPIFIVLAAANLLAHFPCYSYGHSLRTQVCWDGSADLSPETRSGRQYNVETS